MEDIVSYVIYSQFVRFGRNQSLEQIIGIIKDMNFDDEHTIHLAYDFACDLYDENEANGNNDEMYPYRFDKQKEVLRLKLLAAFYNKMKLMEGYIDEMVDTADGFDPEFNIDGFIKDLNDLI